MAALKIWVSRHAAFYSPLIASIAAGFLKDEGFEPTYTVATPAKTSWAALTDGSADVAQIAPSASWAPIERGETTDLVHFAQINQRDGFFLAARAPDPAFTWKKLAGRKVIVDHLGQPMAMFRFACHRMGVNADAIEMIAAGEPEEMDAAFRSGAGDYVHLQGPGPQQLEKDGVGHVVASVGEAIGPVAFSSLVAPRGWLETDAARAFMRAYRLARKWVLATPSAEIARVEQPFFKEVDADVLAATIEAYKALGCWSEDPTVPRDAYETALDVFLHSGRITRRHPYDSCVVPPPDSE